MIQNDMDVHVFQGRPEKAGLGIHNGDEAVFLQIDLAEQLDIDTHGTDKFHVLLAKGVLRGNECAPS
jgi:hypothetical protein